MSVNGLSTTVLGHLRTRKKISPQVARAMVGNVAELFLYRSLLMVLPVDAG
jgi:hypothetical protein